MSYYRTTVKEGGTEQKKKEGVWIQIGMIWSKEIVGLLKEQQRDEILQDRLELQSQHANEDFLGSFDASTNES